MSSYEEVPIIIPAYNPQENLLTIVDSLTKLGTNEIIIVDDGSKMQTKFIFDELRKIKRCTILTHAINMGKGRALKTAFNYCLTNFSHLKGVVTADADGQHACKRYYKGGEEMCRST